MSRLFISHSSQNNDSAIALRDWLVREGWSGPDDIFLDLDPERGIAAGQRWAKALEEAATRCEAVLFLASRQWLASKWCGDEYQLANRLNKKLFALILDDTTLDALPGGLTAQWQVVRMKGEPAERFVVDDPQTQVPTPVYFSDVGLKSLKRGLAKAGVGAETFELQPDQNGPFGWRAPYRGLEALEPEDAAVFFGRSADIVRGIDMLRGLGSRNTPRLLVILGASGAGKSSFLRAGLWPRLLRDDSQWLPLRAIRAGRGGAIEGGEGLLSALEDVQRRFGLKATRADLRDSLATPETFIAHLQELRQSAARRALISMPPFPLPVLCLDQGEEVFSAGATMESEKFVELSRAAIDADAALLIVSIRSDSYGTMQNAAALGGIDQVPLSLGPVPPGEIARIVREPAEILRSKAGPIAPVFDAAVIERLQREIEGEKDALPLLAFVLQRLMREHQGTPTIGLVELERTGGVAAAIESEAEAALDDAGIGRDRTIQREALRRLFIPQLARIDRDSKAPQRHIARRGDVPADLLPLARALTQRRLLVVKLAAQIQGEEVTDTATLEVAHEALLRRWPTLAEILAEDRDSLLLLDTVLQAAADWERAPQERKADYLAHRGSRLSEANAVKSRGANWAQEIAPAQAYLMACQAREDAEREEREAAIIREQGRLCEIAAAQSRTARVQRTARRTLAIMAVAVILGLGAGGWLYRANSLLDATLRVQEASNFMLQKSLDERKRELDRGQVNLLAGLAAVERLRGNPDGALRFAVQATRLALAVEPNTPSPAAAELANAVERAGWSLLIDGQAQVLAANFSPDGRRVVAALGNGDARVFDALTGKDIAVLRGHHAAVVSAAFSPDGTRIVTASWDRTVQIWDAETGKSLQVLTSENRMWSATFSPNGKRIATASDDQSARIWDAVNGKLLLILKGHESPVFTAMFSADGDRVVTASKDGTARIWDASTGAQLATLRHPETVWSAAFSPDGKRVATSSTDKLARIFDARTGAQILTLQGHDAVVRSAAFSPDGKLIVTACFDKTARIWDADKGNEMAVLVGHEDTIFSAAFSPDGTRVATASFDSSIRIWDVSARTTKLPVSEQWVKSVGFSPDGASLVAASEDKTARIYDVATGRPTGKLIGHQGDLWSAAFSPDGTQIVTSSSDKTARVWEAATGRELLMLQGALETVFSAAFNSRGTAIVTASGDDALRIWDAQTGVQRLLIHAPVHAAVFSADGSKVAAAIGSLGGNLGSTVDRKSAMVWDSSTGKQLAEMNGHGDAVWSIAFSPDGTRIVTGSRDKTARVWDAATGAQITSISGHQDQVFSVAFSPDGQRIVTGSGDGTAAIWDVATGKQIVVLRGHTDRVWSVAVSPDATRVATGSFDGTARIWQARFALMPTHDLLMEACLRRLSGHSALSRDEMRLANYAEAAPLINVCEAAD